jgi:hypothetical protein
LQSFSMCSTLLQRTVEVWAWEVCVSNLRIFLYFIDRASCHKFLLITNLMHFFMYLFISSLYMFQASHHSSSRDLIVLIHHLVWLVCVTAWYASQEGIPDRHTKQSHRLIIPDVLIQLDLLIMSTWCLKHVERWNE